MWWIKRGKGKRPNINVTFFGPYSSEAIAQKALAFSRPMNELLDAEGRAALRKFFHEASDQVVWIPSDEMQLIMDDPGGWEYKTVKIRPVSLIRRHASWRAGWGGSTADNAWNYWVTGDSRYLLE